MGDPVNVWRGPVDLAGLAEHGVSSPDPERFELRDDETRFGSVVVARAEGTAAQLIEPLELQPQLWCELVRDDAARHVVVVVVRLGRQQLLGWRRRRRLVGWRRGRRRRRRPVSLSRCVGFPLCLLPRDGRR